MPDRQYTLGNEEDWGDDIGPKLSDQEAARILAELLGVAGDYDYVDDLWPQGKPIGTLPIGKKHQNIYELINTLVQSIPPELRTETVLRQMDLRTLLDPVALGPELESTRVTESLNGRPVPPDQQRLARSWFVDYADKTFDELMAVASQRQDMAPEEQIAWAQEEGNKWRTDKTKIVPMTVTPQQVATQAQTGAVVTTGAKPSDPNGFNVDLSALGGAAADPGLGPRAFLTEKDLQLMFRDSSADSALGAYMEDLSQQAGHVAAGGINMTGDQSVVMWTDPRRTEEQQAMSGMGYTRPGASYQARSQARTGAQTYTLTEARQLPLEMSRAEVMALTEKMKKAGLFDQVPGGEPVIKGDPTDPQFKHAYTLLLGKAIESGRSVPQVLKEGALSYEEALKDQAHTKITDPARIRIQADGLAKNLLGRNLSTVEQGKLVSFIHQLERKGNAADVAADGTPGEPGEGGETVEVDWQAAMEEYLVSNNRAEAGAKDVANTYDMFKGMLGPAGGGIRL